MKTNLLILGIAFGSLLYPLDCLAQSTAFTYQGRLNAGGVPVTGIYDLRFMIFAVPSGGGGGAVAAGPITNLTSINEGLFSVALDFGSNAFNGEGRWLEIAVRIHGNPGGFTTLRPRQPITATPYALRAATYSGEVSASQVTGALPASQLSGALADACLSSNVALLNGNQSFNGANRFNNQANTFSGNGTALTDLSADHLTSGTIADERLSPNVAMLNRNQTFVG